MVIVFFNFSGAEDFGLAIGLRQLTRETKSNVICLQTPPTRRNGKLRMMFGDGRHTTLFLKK